MERGVCVQTLTQDTCAVSDGTMLGAHKLVTASERDGVCRVSVHVAHHVTRHATSNHAPPLHT